MIDTEEAVSRHTDKAGTMVVYTTLARVINDAGLCVHCEVVARRVEYEDMELERGFAITKFLAVKDFAWVSALMQGRDLDCPFLRDALARLEAIETPQPQKDILSLTKEFLNDPSQQ